jgi:uncharacterized protein YbjQ (UPF0145 family)
MQAPTSVKGLKINRTKTIVTTALIASIVISVFCLVSVKALLSQASYQRKVLHSRREALKKLQADETAANQLVSQYHQVFQNSGPSNIIGGKNTTDQNAIPPDGDNARIVLDALPSSYDFPALITSTTKILSLNGIGGPSISSTDQTATLDAKSTSSPAAATIQLTLSGSADYTHMQHLITDLERSIRPFDISMLQISGNNSQMSVSMTLNSYFQPAKMFNVKSQVVK